MLGREKIRAWQIVYRASTEPRFSAFHYMEFLAEMYRRFLFAVLGGKYLILGPARRFSLFRYQNHLGEAFPNFLCTEISAGVSNKKKISQRVYLFPESQVLRASYRTWLQVPRSPT